VAPPATSVPASGFPSNSASPSGEAAAAAHRARKDAAAAIRSERGRRRRRVLQLDELEERDAADAKADGAGGEVMPTAAMAEGRGWQRGERGR
jgi:hypothetical protein